MLAEHDGGRDSLQQVSHGAIGEGGGRRGPNGALPLVNAKPRIGRDFGRLGEGIVDVLWSDEARQVVDIGECRPSSVGGGGEFLELFHEG